MTDIFSVTKEKTVPAWAKFVNAGDSVQGTYIGKLVGMIDRYGNEQIVYQLLQSNGEVINVGFGLNKKVLHADMQMVKFGQIIGFKYKGIATFKDKRTGKDAQVKDFGFHADPKIVNAEWLKENANNMPKEIRADNIGTTGGVSGTANFPVGTVDELDAFVNPDDVPFSSAGSLTNNDKLAAIEKFAKEKLGGGTSAEIKDKVMTVTGIAFIPTNFDAILAKLATV